MSAFAKNATFLLDDTVTSYDHSPIRGLKLLIRLGLDGSVILIILSPDFPPAIYIVLPSSDKAIPSAHPEVLKLPIGIGLVGLEILKICSPEPPSAT